MENEKKKHKSGYDLQKEKITNLQKQLVQAESARNTYSARLDLANQDIHNLKIERDKWKSTADTHLANYDKERYMRYGLEEKVEFLLDHCPFWVRWMYRLHFEKGK